MDDALSVSHARRRMPSTVLIADDHDHSRSAARLVLEHCGFVVTEARSGFDALVLAQASRPRVLLLDIVLPEIDGLQLTRMLRADPTMRNSAIIAITAHSERDYRDAAFAAGCDEFVTKPVAASHLVALVRQFTRRPVQPDHELDLVGAVPSFALDDAMTASLMMQAGELVAPPA